MQVEHDAVAGLLAEDLERLGAGTNGGDCNVVMVQQLGNAHALGGVVLYHEQALVGRLRVALDAREGGLEALDGGGLGNEGKSPTCQAMLAGVLPRGELG